MLRTLLTALLFFFGIVLAHSQRFRTAPLASTSLGYSLIAEYLPEGFAYKPLTLLPSTTVWRRGNFSVYAEGQFTQAIIPTDFRAEYEAGANLGVRFRGFVFSRLALTAAIASGPHFITVETRRQANGFIFSDNFELGLEQYFTGTEAAIHLRARYRHISNAGLQSPNGGIDNLILVVGFTNAW